MSVWMYCSTYITPVMEDFAKGHACLLLFVLRLGRYSEVGEVDNWTNQLGSFT